MINPIYFDITATMDKPLILTTAPRKSWISGNNIHDFTPTLGMISPEMREKGGERMRERES